MSDIEKLLEIMDRLRDPESGCPWDREQDFSTIAPYTIEEAYEVADAIDRSSAESHVRVAVVGDGPLAEVVQDLVRVRLNATVCALGDQPDLVVLTEPDGQPPDDVPVVRLA